MTDPCTPPHKFATHALVRTNVKGIPFRGRCMRCGMEDLPARAALWPCENHKRMSEGDALLRAISGATTDA